MEANGKFVRLTTRDKILYPLNRKLNWRQSWSERFGGDKKNFPTIWFRITVPLARNLSAIPFILPRL